MPPYAVVLGTSLWLAASKRERSLLSGVLTIVASSGLMGVLRLWPGAPALEWREWAVMAVVTLYFIGTVLHVKALIRERNDPRSAPRCIAYHAVLAVLIVGAVAAGWLTWWWIPWAAPAGGPRMVDAEGAEEAGRDRRRRDRELGAPPRARVVRLSTASLTCIAT